MTGPRILTVRQPWAWAIIHAGKDVENRTWRTPYRGRLLIHAGKGFDEYGAWALTRYGNRLPPEVATAKAAREHGGRIVGMVDLVDCIDDSRSPWAQYDCWHWILANPVPAVRPFAVRGRLGLSTAPDGWQEAFDIIKEQS